MHVIGAVYLHCHFKNDFRCVGQGLGLRKVMQIRVLVEAFCECVHFFGLDERVMAYARMILSSIRQTLVLCAQCGFKTRVVTQSEHAHTVVN